MREELKLGLSKTKTLITHARSEAARFLGYEITTLQQDIKRSLNRTTGKKRRSINGRIGLRIPSDVLTDKCNRYKRGGKATARAEQRNESDYTIIAIYQLEYRGITNYYRLAYNMHVLSQLKWVMEQSLTMTLASKHHLSVPGVYAQFKAEQLVDGIRYKGLQVTVPREGKEPMVAVWGGISLKWESKAILEDQPLSRRHWVGRSELEKRLLAQVCEQCGATRLTDSIEVHHIRALKDLSRYTGREKPAWVKNMAARRRKTLVLCRTCHEDIHAGRPMRRQTIKLRNASPVKTG